MGFIHTETMNHLPGTLDHRLTISIILLTCTSSGSVGSLLTGTTALSCHLITTISPDQTHFLDPKIHHREKLCEAVFWVTVTGLTGHCDLSEWTTPTHIGFPLKTVASIGLTNFIHGSSGHKWWWPTYTHTLHPNPNPGIAYALLHQKGQVPNLLLLSSPTAHLYLPQQFYFFHFPSCSEPNI